LYVDPSHGRGTARREIAERGSRSTWVEVDVNDRVNDDVAVKLKVGVDVEVVVEVHGPPRLQESFCGLTARRRR
jgi:hypothetical protein